MTSGLSKRTSMAKPDMSPKAVTVRLIRTSQLRRLCLQLGKQAPPAKEGSAPKTAPK